MPATDGNSNSSNFVVDTPKGGLYSGPFDSSGLDPNVRALMMDNRWTTSPGGSVAATTITYAFPTSADDYLAVADYPETDNINSFKPVTAAQQEAARTAFGLVASYTNLTFVEVSSGLASDAAFRFANYNDAGSESNFPANNGPYAPSDSYSMGDTFLGRNGAVTAAFFGTDGFNTIMHEMGHAFGLKHGHDTTYNGGLASDVNDNEFSVMTYASYFGADTEGATEARLGSAPQSYMMYDIAALQAYYGANFSEFGTSATYTWDAGSGQEYINDATAPFTGVTATDKIFSTVWTQGATTTYDLSDFQANQVDDMRPGKWLTFSPDKIADLNSKAAAGTSEYQAQGNIYNSLLYGSDTRSEISNLVSGSGDDKITGNDLDNVISGNGGNDTVDYSAQAASVDVDLGAGAAYIDRAGVLVLTDQLNSIENAVGGAGDDTLIGDAGANRLDGGSGTNDLYGLDGNDTLIGGTATSGANQLWGGNGSDTVDYSRTAESVYVDLQAQAGYLVESGPSDRPVFVLADTMNSIENVTGGLGDDTLIGDAGANRFDGGLGADDLYGEGGADTFIYTAANDSNLRTGYDTITDFITGLDKIDLSALHTDASHLVIETVGTANAVYINQTIGVFNAATSLAIGVNTTMPGGLHASDFVF
jgi:Ca2+-binding RTX toxin-like protein